MSERQEMMLQRLNIQINWASNLKCALVLIFCMSKLKRSLKLRTTTETAADESERPKKTLCYGVQLGKGSFSQVYESEDQTGKKIAIKIVKKKDSKQRSLKEVAQQQIRILSGLRHPNIVKYLDSQEEENRYVIKLQKVEGKTLSALLSQDKSLSESQIFLLAKGLLEALCFLNRKNMMHRDIKPDNIFFHQGKVTLIDFGLACQLNEGQKTMMSKNAGTLHYMSPEILDSRNYTNKSDVWSFGIVLYKAIYGKYPWKSSTKSAQLETIKQYPLTVPSLPKVSPILLKLLSECLRKKPQDRISWKKLQQFLSIEYIQEECPQKVVKCSFLSFVC